MVGVEVVEEVDVAGEVEVEVVEDAAEGVVEDAVVVVDVEALEPGWTISKKPTRAATTIRATVAITTTVVEKPLTSDPTAR